MKTSMKYLVLLLGIVAFMLDGCKEECPCQDETNPVCANYNPCWDQKPVSADFEMSAYWPFKVPNVPEFNADVAFGRGNIAFRPIGYSSKDTSTSYTWIIGTEIVQEATVVRDFRNTEQTGENDIPITLIVHRKPNLDCFPMDDGRDTVTKYIHFVETQCEFLTNGDFKVLFDGYKDSVVVGIRNWKNNSTWDKFIYEDTCEWTESDLQSIGFNPNKNFRDTVELEEAMQLNSWIYPQYRDHGLSTIQKVVNGRIKVDPVTLQIEAYYDIMIHPNLVRYSFKGRKIK